jgi:hypothetical protein
MDKNQNIINVSTDYDVIFARMRTREVARSSGLNTPDQARVSLAVSSLAQKLGLGFNHQGKIAIETTVKDGRTGVRVVFYVRCEAEVDSSFKRLENMRWMFMVDDLKFERSDPYQVKVTAIKWSESEKASAARG